MPKNGGRKARLAAQERAELEAFRAQAAVAAAQPASADLLRCDWRCGRCGYHNFGKNVYCRQCNGPRHAGAALHGIFRGRGGTSTNAGSRNLVAPTMRVQNGTGRPGFLPVGRQPNDLHSGHANRLPPAQPHPPPLLRQPGLQHTSAQSKQQQQGAEAGRVSVSREAAHKKDGKSWADVVRDPAGAGSADDKRVQSRIDDTATATQQSDTSNLGTAQRQVGGPQVFELEHGESDGEEQPEGGEPPEPPTPKNLQAKMRNLETKKERRQRKLQRQQNEVELQAEFVEAQQRQLVTLEFEVAETREDISAIDRQMAAISKLHTELLAARVAAQVDEATAAAADTEDEAGASAALHQVFEAMRNYGSIRSPTIRRMLSTFVQEMHELQNSFSPIENPGDETPKWEPGRSPSRSPPPRSPTPPAKSPSTVVQQMPPPTPAAPPTEQMRREAEAALQSNDMWEDQRVPEKRKCDEILIVAVPQPPSLEQAAEVLAPLPRGRERALAICDRPLSEPRGRAHGRDSNFSPARSRGRRELYKDLNERVESQRRAARGNLG